MTNDLECPQCGAPWRLAQVVVEGAKGESFAAAVANCIECDWQEEPMTDPETNVQCLDALDECMDHLDVALEALLVAYEGLSEKDPVRTRMANAIYDLKALLVDVEVVAENKEDQ